MLINLAGTALTATLSLFNHCLSTGTYPWHNSVITPIHKSGDKYDPDNYRAIAVSSCLGKLFSSILLSRLVQFRKEHCPDPINQLGFCENAQTNDHIFTLRTLGQKYLSQGKRVFACFVDFRKAFDSVSREALLFKLINLGMSGKFFATLENMYKNTCSRVKLSSKLSDKIFHKNGVEQGHPLSPELFKMFIIDLTEALNDCISDTSLDFLDLMTMIINHLLWADDLILLGLNEKTLQHLIDILVKYCSIWGLTTNIKKTKVMIFNKAGRLIKPNTPFMLGDLPLECVNRYTYLGITITPNLNFNHATKHFTINRSELFSVLLELWTRTAYLINLYVSFLMH